MRFNFKDILKALTEITLKSKNSEEKSEAIGLKKKLENFEFLFHIVLFSKILHSINIVSKVLQSKKCSIVQASNLLKNAYDELCKLRHKSDEIRCESSNLAANWGIEAIFIKKRQKQTKQFFDELASDTKFTAEDRFKKITFNNILDIASFQLKNRLSGFQNVVEKFKFLEPSFLTTATDTELHKQAEILRNKYDDDLSDDFATEILNFRSAFSENLKELSTIDEIVDFIFCKNHTSSSNFNNVCIALLLFLTLPVTSASAERSFSKLNLIKSYLRNSVSQARLSSLAILSIENKCAKEINFDKVIDVFASFKNRKRIFNNVPTYYISYNKRHHDFLVKAHFLFLYVFYK